MKGLKRMLWPRLFSECMAMLDSHNTPSSPVVNTITPSKFVMQHITAPRQHRMNRSLLDMLAVRNAPLIFSAIC